RTVGRGELLALRRQARLERVDLGFDGVDFGLSGDPLGGEVARAPLAQPGLAQPGFGLDRSLLRRRAACLGQAERQARLAGVESGEDLSGLDPHPLLDEDLLDL